MLHSTESNLLQTSSPRITVVTPSYNQGHFIEETIQSVLSQNYPNLEYIIIDGGSTDNTVDIIKKYESQIAYWVSEPDRGQTHAINKGFARATGEILAYLNSDDYYLPETLLKVADYFLQHPQTDLLHGRCRYVNQQGTKIGDQFGNIKTVAEIIDLWGVWWNRQQFVQPEVFWTRRISDRVGAFNESLYFVMDYDYWCRILLAGGQVGSIDQELSCFRLTDTQKSNQSDKVADELLTLVQPWLWNAATPISPQKRLTLQSRWLYQAVLQRQIARSLETGESKQARYLKLLQTISHHPKILLAPRFYERFQKVLFQQ